MKKLVIVLLTLIMVMSGVCILPADGNKALANGTDNGYRVEEVKMSSLSKNELPTCTDTSKEWLFAGWYKDANCETAYTSYPSGNTAYAKFVPENVLSVKLQLKEGTGTGGADEKTNLRLVSSVDCADYRKVGFEIYYNGAKTPIIASSSKVFKKIVASSESGVDYNYSPKVVDVESEYFVTATLINIAKTNFDKSFYIRPFWITSDGTTVYGVNRYINVNNGISETNVNVPVKTDDKVTSPTVKVAGNTYDASVAYYDGTYTHLNINVPSKDTTLKSVSEVTVSEGDVTGKAVYRNLYNTHESGDFANPNADTTWYDADSDTYVIATSADLYGFASLVNGGETFEDKTVYMVSDITVNDGKANHADLTWTPDGTQYGWTTMGGNGGKAVCFAGEFDGQMHTISGIYMEASQAKSGLFAGIASTAKLKNFKLTNSYFDGNGKTQIGSIAGYVWGGTIENVYSDAIVNAGGEATGGLVGAVDITISDFAMQNCWFNGTATNNTKFLGGLIGVLGSSTSSAHKQIITNCLNSGNLPSTSSASRWVGGLLGYNYGSKLSMTHCLNSGEVGRQVDTYAAQFSLIGNFSYSNPSVSNTYTTKQTVVTNFMNQTHADAMTNILANSSITGISSMTSVVKSLFTYVTDTDTYTNESYWAIVPGKAPVLSAFADMVEGQCQAVDTSWYNKNDDTFNLKDAADLYGLSLLTRDAQNSAGFENKTIVLDKDILMNEGITYNENGVVEDDTPNEWLAIGTETEPFKGNFDGDGNNISGLYLNAASAGNGLFGYTYKDVSIKNFSLTNSYFYSSASAYSDLGSIVGRTEGGEFDSIYSNAIVNGRCDRIGGLIGRVEGEDDFSINNCWFDGSTKIDNSRTNIGGIIGYVRNEAGKYDRTITNCLNTGIVQTINSGTEFVGGLIGYNGNGAGLSISNCLNANQIQYNSSNVNLNTLEKLQGKKYGLIAGQLQNDTKVENVYTIPQANVPNVGNGKLLDDSVVKEVSSISGIKAIEQLASFFKNVTVNDKSKVYWAITDTAPVLADFVGFVDEDNAAVAIDTSWYNNSNSYTLYDAADLYGFAKLVNEGNDFIGKTVKLGANIAIPNRGVATDWATNAPAFDWISIGTDDAKFNGTFDGKGYEISNIYVNTTNGDQGLFGHTDIKATIRNFSLTNSYIKSEGKMVGSVVGHAEGGTFDTIYSSAIVESSNIQVGGIIGNVEGVADFKMNNCWFAGSVTNTGGANLTGGLIGSIYVASGFDRTIANCLNTGIVGASNAATRHMGGLVGYSTCGATLTISNCLNTRTIEYQTTDTTNNTSTYGLIGGTLGAAVINSTYVTSQENLSNYCNGKVNEAFTIDESLIYGISAMEQIPDFFVSVEEGGQYKSYWITTDATPILKDFAKYGANVSDLAIDISWYGKTNTLDDASDLYGFAVLSRVEDFTGKTVKLGKDIEIPNVGNAEDWATTAPEYKWFGIGTADSKFNGTFDGNGNNISGLYMNATKTGTGLFGYTGPTVAIKNVALTNSYFYSSASAYADLGSVVGRTEGGSFDSIYSDAIVYGACNNIGGLIGHMEGTANFSINNCWYNGDLTVANSCDNVGGLIGHVKNESGKYSRIVTNCLNSGEIKATNSGTKYMGGLIGLNNSGAGLTIEKCLNTKEIQYAGTVNTAKLTDKTTYLYGLIAGQVNTATVINDVYTITQEFLPSEGYGFAFEYEPQKTIDEISGANATVNMTNLFTAQTADGKDYWVVTNGTPILSSFIEYADAEQVGVYTDTSWYNKNDNEFTINTAEELCGLAKLCNNRVDTFAGKTIKLGSDIQLNVGVATDWEKGENLPINMWTPIGITPGTAFRGTFDGQGYTISGLYLQSSKEYVGLFGVLEQAGNATIKNLRVENSYLERTLTTWHDNYGLGSIAGQGAGTLENIYSDAILVNQGTHTGGLVGNVLYISETTQTPALTVNNCWYTGKVTSGINATEAKDDWVGGIIGRVASKATVNMTECLVAANLNSQLQSTYLSNKEDQTSTTAGKSYIGGLSGRMGAGTIQSSLAYGSMSCINGTKSNLVGNIVRDTLKIVECYNAMGTTQNYTLGTDVNVPDENVDIIALEDRGAGNYNLVFADKNASDYASYCDDLTNKKFTKYVESSAGDENGKVYNATFVRDEIVITVVFMEKAGEICISIEKDLPLSNHLKSEAAYSGAERADSKTSLHMLGFAEGNYGDSFVIQLKNGHFIISDGGMQGESGTLYDYLISLTGGETPVIEAWFISHGHDDHIGALRAFVENETYYKNVCVNGVYFNAPNPNGFDSHYLSAVKRVSNLRTESNEITQIYRPKTGQRYYFDDITIDVLHTQEQLALDEYVNTNGNEFNETSTWLMFTMDGYTFLHAGDAAQNSVNTVIGNYSENYFDFDVMATLHHAQNIYTNFIDTFDYDILLYTTKNKWSQNDSASDADNEAMLNKAQYAYAWGEGTVALTFSKNNGIKLPTGTWFID